MGQWKFVKGSFIHIVEEAERVPSLLSEVLTLKDSTKS